MNAFRPLSLAELFALELPPVEYAVDNLLPLGAATLFSAREKAGKGLLTLDLCACVAFEEPFLDRAVRAGPAIYCAAEENVRDVRDRIGARVGTRRDGPLHVLPLDGSTGDRLDLSDAGAIQKLYNMVNDTAPVVVVLDVLREIHNGREDISDDMAPLLRPIRQLAHDRNVAVVVNHHMSKSGGYRGSTAIRAAFDVEIAMTPDDIALGGGLTASLDVVGRFGPRQQLKIKLGDGLRWQLASATVTVGEDTLRARLLRLLADGDAWMTADDLAAASGMAKKTVQNAISDLLRGVPPAIVTEGRGVKNDPRRYRLPQVGLFPPNDDPLRTWDVGNDRDLPSSTVPDRSGNNGRNAGELSEAVYEDVPV